ncbi:MAG TPA: alpha/beta family hydrolase [Pirellulales bacterium]|nr:alpha/beta family hydrolase [Pirellulales bacterium]
MSDFPLLFDGPDNARWTVALAHGAGAGMETPFMTWFAEALAARGVRAARFEFPYMDQRRRSGKKGPPDRTPVLIDTWQKVIESLPRERLVIGGKSMGGRIASMVADAGGVRGLICLGYPFHPVGKPDERRIEHLRTLATPTLILQGTRDPFGSQSEVAGYGLSPAIQIHWLADGDHDFKPRKASGRTQIELWEEAASQIEEFLGRLV